MGSIALAWGFTVDDALISTRVAHHLATNGRYAFNATGPSVDCVTPLGWAWLLAPLSRQGAWSGLEAARWLGAACTLATAFVVNALFAQREALVDLRGRPAAWQFLLPAAGLWLLNLPLGAWASSGMETALVMLLCTLSTWGSVQNKTFGFACAGVAAGLRPELIPWALVLGVSHVVLRLSDSKPRLQFITQLLIIVAPPLMVALIRFLAFGSPTPLAVLAKPSAAASGFAYVRGGLTLLGVPVLLLAFRTWKRVPGTLKCVGLSLLAHVLSLVAAGGDWMSLFRLFVPLLPSMLWLGACVTTRQGWATQTLKYALAFLPSAVLYFNLGPASSQVVAARRELVQSSSPLLAHSRHIATLDVGWVGAATNQSIVDLAGVTDLGIAILPGGHTSKRLPSDLLRRRDVDTLVLLLKPGHRAVEVGEPLLGLEFARVVENRVATLEEADAFRVSASLPLRGTTQHYLILERN